MAIRKYALNANERAMTGFSEVYVIKQADFVINATTTHTLANLKKGDILFPQFMLVEVKTAVAGPTATLTLGISGTVAKWMAATTIASAQAHLTPKGIAANMGTPTGAEIATEMNRSIEPFVMTADDTLVAQAVVSNVAITAGEVRIWMRITRQKSLDNIIL